MHSTFQSLNAITEKDAARLLVTETALGQLGAEDALRLVRHMKPKRIKAGSILAKEGDKEQNDFLMLILSGDVRVESHSGSPEEAVITVLGAGSLIGEMSMINNSPRSATCIATTDLAVAVMRRTTIKKILAEQPDLAARFMLAVSSRLALRLRDTTLKLKKFMQLLQNEVYMLMDAQSAIPKRMRRSDMPTEPMSLRTLQGDLMSGHHDLATPKNNAGGNRAK
jgi:CRP/FNR family transcriptional regulator, cyclic AMP receptor protein